jgi:hypothetical protein
MMGGMTVKVTEDQALADVRLHYEVLRDAGDGTSCASGVCCSGSCVTAHCTSDAGCPADTACRNNYCSSPGVCSGTCSYTNINEGVNCGYYCPFLNSCNHCGKVCSAGSCINTDTCSLCGTGYKCSGGSCITGSCIS